jgi:glycosyltransferase involved in cell wall biosynthesis
MRLTLLTPTLDRSGAEKQLTLLACGLKESTDWDIEVVALTRGGPYQQVLEDKNVPVKMLNKRFRFDLVCYRRLKSHLAERAPDILHTWMFTANSYGRIAAGRHPPFKVIVSERCVDTWKSGWQRCTDRFLRKRTDRLIANSKPVAEFYRDLGIDESIIEVIPNGVAIPPPPDPEVRRRLHREWNLPENAKVVGYVGRLARQKRLDDLMWGFQLFQQLSDNTYFVIVGDGPERSRLEDLAIRYTCDHLTRFVGHQPNAAELMPAFDLFWLASDFEGMSNSLMEAMAAGIPAVASDIPANRELVVPGVTGELFPIGERMVLAQQSDRILNVPETYDSMSAASVERMKQEFSVQRMVERHRDLYDRVLASS